MCEGLEASPTHRAINPALYSPVHKSMITKQSVRDCDFIQSDHLAYTNDLTPSNYYLFRNLKFYLRGVRYARHCMIQGCLRCESFPFNGL